ncbi:MAG: hypothetical protein JXQ69_03260 [Paludibacteraceae bacterium]|nr:hypothetical protein [Paludibacteraceae bacterium]MBN2787322.1 hypothetical protein [Paludibacteraceae bacterium]
MKRIVIAFIGLVCSIVAFAQDVIITKKAEQLKVKIVELSADEVKYRQLDKIVDGPIFVLKAEEVLSIVFFNGSVVVNDQTTGKLLVAMAKEETPQPIIKKEEKVYSDSIEHFGGFYFYQGKKMSDSQFEDLLENNCVPAYMKYKAGETLQMGSNGLFVPGIIFLGMGAGLLAFDYNIDDIDSELENFALIATIAGGAAILVSIPLKIIGAGMKSSAANLYNNTCVSKSAAQLNLNLKTNGVGLALSF